MMKKKGCEGAGEKGEMVMEAKVLVEKEKEEQEYGKGEKDNCYTYFLKERNKDMIFKPELYLRSFFSRTDETKRVYTG